MSILQLSVIRAINVPVADARTSDPYIKIYQIFGDKEIKVGKTQVVKKELNPEWNETFN